MLCDLSENALILQPPSATTKTSLLCRGRPCSSRGATVTFFSHNLRTNRITFGPDLSCFDPYFANSTQNSTNKFKIQNRLPPTLFASNCNCVWYGMVNVDLYSAIITIVSNAPNTPVSREKPGFQALSKGLIVLLCATTARRSSGKEFQTMGLCTANARRPTVDSRCRGTTTSWCEADLRRCLPTTSVTGVQQSTRYCGALTCRHT